ncbi:threonine--tRNA ligase [bacterium]|nr:threonine--tRNA ligase [bacterium]
MPDQIHVTLPDGRVVEAAAGAAAKDVARSAALPRLADALAVRIDGKPADLDRALSSDCHLALILPEDPDALHIYRHTTSHLMAQAIKELFPETKIAQGPATEEGFYYDFGRATPFTDDDLPKIEERMREIVARALPIVRREVSKDEALRLFGEEQEPYKLHFVREKSGPVASYYQQGEFRDFCLGPHLPNTAKIGAFKLLSVAAAYWLGSEKNETLWRIYGTAFPTEAELEAHLTRLEEAKKRDHRRLCKDLDLVSIHEKAGAGLIFWHPRGTIVRREIEEFLREELNRRNYVFVTTPHMYRNELFKTSGHYDYYRDNMFRIETPEEEELFAKPMNCPGHVMIYDTGVRSYRELPVRMAEFGTVYRYERTGTMHGLFRVRGFTQDDAHIFCRPDQINEEVEDLLDLVKTVFDAFGFAERRYELSVWDPAHRENYVGEPEEWDAAEKALKASLDKFGLEHKRYVGEAAFYGPKIDVKVFDAIGRPWQLSTIQFDFNLPRRFGISFVDADGQRKTPYMVHRAIVGSLERFFGILVEHFAGAFPPWLAPVQAKVLPVSEKVAEYAESLGARLKAAGIRVEVDRRPEKIGAKIRDAELEKIPYMLVVGPREAQADAVSLRLRKVGDQGTTPVAAFVERALAAIKTRSLEP